MYFFKCDLQLLSPDEVSPDVLQKTNGALQRLRMSVFKQLQPKLHCKLGEGSSLNVVNQLMGMRVLIYF